MSGRLVLRWVTVSGFNSRYGHLFRYATNQPPMANSAFHPSGVGKWVPASAGKAKAGMVHSVSRWTRGVQVKLWDPLRMRVIPERLRGVFTTRRYTNSCLPLPYLSTHVHKLGEKYWEYGSQNQWKRGGWVELSLLRNWCYFRCKIWPEERLRPSSENFIFLVWKWYILVYSDALFEDFHTYLTVHGHQPANYSGCNAPMKSLVVQASAVHSLRLCQSQTFSLLHISQSNVVLSL